MIDHIISQHQYARIDARSKRNVVERSASLSIDSISNKISSNQTHSDDPLYPEKTVYRDVDWRRISITVRVKTQ